MTPVERRIEDAKNADRQAVRRAMLKLEQRAEWKHADPEEQSCLEEATKQQIMDTRIRDGCAAVCVADSLGYTEQSISATWDNGNAAWVVASHMEVLHNRHLLDLLTQGL